MRAGEYRHGAAGRKSGMAETDERPMSEAVEIPTVSAKQPEIEMPPVEAPASPTLPASDSSPSVARTGSELPRAASTSAHSQPRARRRRRWRIAVGVFSVVAVIASVILLVLPVPPARPVRPAVVLIVPRGDGVECARDTEWAPDSTRLVVLGYARGCPDASGGATGHTGTVLIYSALTGALISRIQPDARIILAAGASPNSEIEYSAVLWSPDGKRLAISFGVTSGGPSLEGVYLCDANGGHARVLLHTSASGRINTGMWDLQAGTYIPEAPLPPALSYRWTPDGALAAPAPLTATAVLPAPQLRAIGDPDGGTAFSTWQPGAITLRAIGTTSQDARGGAYVLSTSYAVWSPDGRYLIPSAGIEARVPSADASAPSRAILAALGLENAPVLPVRDRALQIALDRLGALAPDQHGNSPMLVAWSPEGRLLAVQLVPSERDDVPHISHHALVIYDCATGKPLVALTPDATPTPTEGLTLVRWSPNGARLLLFDNQLGTLTIFGRSKIPPS
jgi:WD40-like Beta Propeller Repeat